jgi:DNA-binding response OmpR family regulator
VRRKGSIVVVETDDLIRGLLERWLGEEGFAVIATTSGAPVLKEAPRLVITNISDPRGAEELIRSLQAVYAAPILAISARFRRGLGASEAAARRLGVCKVLPKPFTRAELIAAVRDAIKAP